MRETRRVEKAAKAQKKRKEKIVLYNMLVKDYIKKVREKDKITPTKKLRDSAEMKKILRDLKKGTPEEKKAALQKTIRGDKVGDWTPYIKRWEKGDL